MKRIFLLGLAIVFGALALQAASPWAGEIGLDPGQYHAQKRDVYSILAKLSSGQPISVHIQFANPTQEETRKFYEKAIRKAYGDWFDSTAEIINKNEHKKEFAQMLARLKKRGKVNFVSSAQEADLPVLVEPLEQIGGHCGNEKLEGTLGVVCFYNQQLQGMYLPEWKGIQAFVLRETNATTSSNPKIEGRVFAHVVQHEIGHTLGLSDQYEQNIKISHRIYRSTRLHKGLMSGDSSFSCDDADGLVNLIDAIYGTEPGRKYGWKSLCPNSPDVYVDGIAKGTGPYFVNSKDERTWTLHTYKGNKQIARQDFELIAQTDSFFDITDQQELQKDELGRVVRAQGPQGEMIYYDYNYNAVGRLITKGNKVLRVEYNKDIPTQGGVFGFDLNPARYHERLFVTPQNQKVVMNVLGALGSGAAASYIEGDGQNPLLRMDVEFNSQGTVTKREIKGTQVPRETESEISPQRAARGALLEQKVAEQRRKEIEAKRVQFEAWAKKHAFGSTRKNRGDVFSGVTRRRT